MPYLQKQVVCSKFDSSVTFKMLSFKRQKSTVMLHWTLEFHSNTYFRETNGKPVISVTAKGTEKSCQISNKDI